MVGSLVGRVLEHSALVSEASRLPVSQPQAQSKPNLTYSDLSCQVWVLSGTFLAFGGGLVSFDVCAAIFALRNQFGAKLGEFQA